MSDDINNKNIFKAFIKAQGELKSIPIDGKNPHFNSKYATLASTQETIREVFKNNGLAVMQLLEDKADNNYQVKTILIHESGESIESVLTLMVDRKNMQGLGSATTYAKRYALQAMAGVSGGEDDDDGNAASKTKGGEPYQQPAPKKTYDKVEPENYVMTMGSDQVKGKKLGELSLDSLNAIDDFLGNKIKEGKLTEKQQKFYGFVLSQVRKVQVQKEPQDTPPSYNEDHQDNVEYPLAGSMSMEDFEPPLESTNKVIERLKEKHGGNNGGIK